MTIAQLSDIHMSGYMPARKSAAPSTWPTNWRRSRVVTGDFITGTGDPIAECIEKFAALSASGIYGCNGNHEVYADAEDLAQELFARHGMKLLRHQSEVIPSVRS